MVTRLRNDDIMIKITQPSHLANQTQCILSCYQGASGTRRYSELQQNWRGARAPLAGTDLSVDQGGVPANFAATQSTVVQWVSVESLPIVV